MRAISLLVATLVALLPVAVHADTFHRLEPALKSADFRANLNHSIHLNFQPRVLGYTGSASHHFRVSRSHNAILNNREAACRAALLEALQELQEDAEDLHGTSVVHISSIRSNGHLVASRTKYACKSGSLSATVTLDGYVLSNTGRRH